MEAMALDEGLQMDQDHWQKSGRGKLEQTVQSQISAKELDVIEEIRAKERQIEAKERQIEAKERQIEAKERQVEAKEVQIEAKERQIEAVELAISSGTERRSAVESTLQFLRQQITSLLQQITNLGQEKMSLQQQMTHLVQQLGNLQQERTSLRSVQAESSMPMDTMKKLIEDAVVKIGDSVAKIVRDSTAKSGIESLSMSSITTELAEDVLTMADFSVMDGSALDPAEEVPVSKDWKFDMGRYAREEDCYEPFFKHMVKYLNTVHAVNIQKDPPFHRGAGCCRLLDVHNLKQGLELGAVLGDRTLKITGNLDAVFVPPRCGLIQYKISVLGGVKVKHSTAHKETYKHGAPTVGTAKSGRSTIPGQALMEALAVYAYSDLPKGIFLFTSYDDNAVLELKDREIWCWTKLNFAQAMSKIAAFMKGEDVRKFLEDSEKPARSRKLPPISESKRSVRKKLNIGLGKEEFLEQVDVIRSAAGSELEMVSDLFQLVESWRYCRTEACGSTGPLSYFS